MKNFFVLVILFLLAAGCAPVRSVGGTATPTRLQPMLTNPTLSPEPTSPAAPTNSKPATPANPTAAAPANPTETVPATPTAVAASNPAAGIPNFDHIILIILENRDYSVAMDGTSMPHFDALAQKYVLLSNYFAISHPSVPNYIALMSGSTQNITSDCTTCFLNSPNLADEVDKSGRTWKAYMQSMPSPCYIGDSKTYAQKHNPLLYFDSIRLNVDICNNSIVPMTQLDTDLKANNLPNFSFIMPNLCDSGHDCSATTADNWLSDMVDKLQNSSTLGQNSLIIVTFDEAKTSDKSSCCGMGSGGGHVATILISPQGKSGFTDKTAYSHYSLLKTILAAWNLPQLGRTEESTIEPILAPWTAEKK